MKNTKSLKTNLKLQIDLLEREKFSGSRKIFTWLISLSIFAISLLIIAFSYLYESLCLACGSFAFFLTFLNYIYEILKPFSPSLSKTMRNLIIFACILMFGIFSLCEEKDETCLKMIGISEALFGISVGFFLGLIIIKPLRIKAFK